MGGRGGAAREEAPCAKGMRAASKQKRSAPVELSDHRFHRRADELAQLGGDPEEIASTVGRHSGGTRRTVARATSGPSSAAAGSAAGLEVGLNSACEHVGWHGDMRAAANVEGMLAVRSRADTMLRQ